MLVAALPPTFTASCPLGVETGELPDDWCIDDAMVTTCVFPRRAQTTPLSEHQEVLLPSTLETLVGRSQGGRGRIPAALKILPYNPTFKIPPDTHLGYPQHTLAWPLCWD